MLDLIASEKITIDRIIENTNSILKKLTEKGELIIPDTNIINDTEFLNNSYQNRNYHEVKDYELDDLKKSLEFGINIVTNIPNVFIASNLVEEAKEFHRIFSERIKYYNQKNINFIKNHKNSERYETRKEMCQKLTQLSFNLNKILKNSVYIPEDKELYDNLNFVVCALTEKLESKRDVNRNSDPRPYRRENEKFKTDEELVTLAYYLLMKEQKDCSIISGDTDIYRILNNCTRFIKSERGTNEYLKSLLEKHTISLYNPITNSSGKRDVREPMLITSAIEGKLDGKYERILFGEQ